MKKSNGKSIDRLKKASHQVVVKSAQKQIKGGDDFIGTIDTIET